MVRSWAATSIYDPNPNPITSRYFQLTILGFGITMDDLSGLSWTPNSNDTKKPPPMSSGMPLPSVRLGGTSGRSTPASVSSGPSIPPSKPATPGVDSFANLVSFGSSNADKNLSLLERQKRLQERKAQKEAEKRNQFEAQYGAQNTQFWDNFERGGNKPAVTAAPSAHATTQSDEDDLLAAFNASVPVDASTHFPVPSSSPIPRVQTASSQKQKTLNGTDSLRQGNDMTFLDDDDPFGLSQLKQKSTPATQPVQDDDDDFLGLLGKPVSEVARPEPQASPAVSPADHHRSPSPPQNALDGVDRAIAELVDMGFPADKAKQALSTTESGTDVQAAVGWLLTQAHAESRRKTRERTAADNNHHDSVERRGERNERRDRDVPAWMREGRSHASRNHDDIRVSPADKDPAQIAAALGNNLLKTANALWKSGSKKVQQVVHDLNTEHDPNQPRWMRDASFARDGPRPQTSSRERHQAPSRPEEKPGSLTDEALLLESQPSRPSRHPTRHPTPPVDGVQPGAASAGFRRQPPPAAEKRMPQPEFMRQQNRFEPKDPKSRLNKAAIEEQSAQAYVSPARRKRPVAQPPVSQRNVDLLQSSAPSPADRSRPSAPPAPRPRSPTSNTLPARPKAPPRNIPNVSQEALASTHRQREKGAEAYKRGDYAAAHEAFTAALATLPDKHPITIIIRSNRAITALKIGEAKTAVDDADTMLSIIGPSKGEAETIDLRNGEPAKPMKDFFGKALMRKAEALEQLERWADAATAWRQAVEAGYGGSTSIQGRNRCEKAAGISKPTPKAPAPVKRPAPKKPSAPSPASSEAVDRLRAANQAADRVDEEKFNLAESVDARMAAWKNGKQDNLRALLASLDTVLWPEAGWKKVNMSELIMPSKVKVQYMKGIAKVHPDKVCITLPNQKKKKEKRK